MTCEYMLVTIDPLYSSKSFHRTMPEVMDRIEDIVTLTERYYERMRKTFTYAKNPYTSEYPGIYVFKIWPQKPQLAKLLGKPKQLRMQYVEPSKTGHTEDAGSREEGTPTLPIRDRRHLRTQRWERLI